jgi:ribonuclease E
MKDVMRSDRARVQIGSISHFGLLEMSRQRLRLSINESISNLCPHCEGTGRIRSIDTAAMQVLRSIEDEAQKGKMGVLHITVHRDIALFILNYKRSSLVDIESRFELSIILHSDDSLIAPEYRVEREVYQSKLQSRQNNHQLQKTANFDEVADNDSQTGEVDAVSQFADDATSDDDQPKRRRRGRRGGRRRRGKRSGEDNNQIERSSNDDSVINDQTGKNADDTEASRNDDGSNLDKAAGDQMRQRSVAKNLSAQNEKDEATRTKSLKAGDDQSQDAAADTASSSDSVKSKKSKSAAKPTRKKAAKKPTKTSAASDKDGPDSAKTIKVDAKKPARGRKPKLKRQTDTKDAKSDDTGNGTVAKTRARKSSTKKVKKSSASKTDNTKIVPARTSADDDNRIANRTPISSAPQDVIEVGSAAPDARKRGWWSRGE